MIPFTSFYRRYPYRGGLATDSADARGCVDFQLGFFYNRIPKAANSTIITTLARLCFNREIPSKEAKKLFLSPALLYKDEVKEFDQLFRFTFVRNPFSRTLSAYLDKVERRAKRNGIETSYLSFLQELDKGKLHTNGHWTPQSDLLLIPFNQFDFIGKVESLESDLHQVTYQLQKVPGTNADITSVLSNATHANKKLADYYDEKSVELVRKLYRQDFELFDYPQDPPA